METLCSAGAKVNAMKAIASKVYISSKSKTKHLLGSHLNAIGFGPLTS